MGPKNDSDGTLVSRIANFNILSWFLVTFVAFGIGRLWEWLSIVQNTLVTVEVCVAVIVAWNLAGYFLIQESETFKTTHVGIGIFSSMIISLLFHLVTVVYGMPLTELVSETYHFAVLLTAVTAVPCLAVMGPDLEAWIRVFIRNSPYSALEVNVQMTTLFSLAGAWLGAFPIPLDWDRPWQVWPISCVIGTILGYLGGLLVASVRITQADPTLQDRKMKLR